MIRVTVTVTWAANPLRHHHSTTPSATLTSLQTINQADEGHAARHLAEHLADADVSLLLPVGPRAPSSLTAPPPPPDTACRGPRSSYLALTRSPGPISDQVLHDLPVAQREGARAWKGASRFRALVLIGTAATLCAAFTPHMTKPSVASKRAETNYPRAVGAHPCTIARVPSPTYGGAWGMRSSNPTRVRLVSIEQGAPERAEERSASSIGTF